MLTTSFFVSLLNSMLRMSTPLILATTGEIVAERSGVINIGLEGQMLLGAFTALCVTYATGSAPPVSYTHLDVYKRQTLYLPGAGPVPFPGILSQRTRPAYHGAQKNLFQQGA